MTFITAIAIDHVAFVVDGGWVAVDDAPLDAGIFDLLWLWLIGGPGSETELEPYLFIYSG